MLSKSSQKYIFQIPRRLFASFPGGEPERPIIKTQYPGPLSKKHIESLSEMTETLTCHFPMDIDKSRGNYIADIDGNVYLDVFGNIGSIALGYNHPRILEAVRSEEFGRLITNRTALGINPPKEMNDLIQKAFVDIAPLGLSRVIGQMCGSCSVEVAFKYAMILHAQKKRGGKAVPPTKEELDSCACNIPPGSPNVGILSFRNGFHGRLFGALSATRTKPLFKLDIPAFDWPAADAPRYKFPLEANAAHNGTQDELALKQVRSLIEQWKREKGCEVCAVIIEPIMAEGGDQHISSGFAQGLRDLTTELGIFMIVDEVQTGCVSSGTYWAHEQWQLTSPPDFMTFAKKMTSCGVFMREEHRMATPYRHFNTWMGDMSKALLTRTQNEVIKEDNLIDHARETGEYFKEKLQKVTPGMISDVRGRGTLIGYDVKDAEMRDNLLVTFKEFGINTAGCGTHTVRLRPSFYFGKKHVDIYIEALEKSLAKLAQK